MSISILSFAQEMPTKSQLGKVVQKLGGTTIEINYSRPNAKGRKIWGDLVPYGQVLRLGANESTKITTSGDITIGGSKLKKGTYSMFATPGEEKWIFHFNSNLDAWGANDYSAESNILSIEASPKMVDSPEAVESMQFTFENTIESKAEIILAWGMLTISIPVEEN